MNKKLIFNITSEEAKEQEQSLLPDFMQIPLPIFEQFLFQDNTQKLAQIYKSTKEEDKPIDNDLSGLIEPSTSIIEPVASTKDLEAEEISGNILSSHHENIIISKIENTPISELADENGIVSLSKENATGILTIYTKDYQDSFSSIQLFDPSSISEPRYVKRGVFSINKVEITEDSEEIEILVRNNNENEMNNLNIKITHIKEYFEQEVMNQHIDIWFPKEELIFISPIIPLINEYLFFIVEEKSQKRLFSQKIDLNVIKKSKIKSIR